MTDSALSTAGPRVVPKPPARSPVAALRIALSLTGAVASGLPFRLRPVF